MPVGAHTKLNALRACYVCFCGGNSAARLDFNGMLHVENQRDSLPPEQPLQGDDVLLGQF